MAIAPANESQRLGQLLSQRGELSGTFGEVLDRLELFGGRGGDRFGFLRGCLRAVASLRESLGDLCRELGALAPDISDLLAGSRGVRCGLCDAAQVLHPGGGALDDLTEIATHALDQLGCA